MYSSIEHAFILTVPHTERLSCYIIPRYKETTHKAGGIAAALKLRDPNLSNELKIASHVGPTWAQCNT